MVAGRILEVLYCPVKVWTICLVSERMVPLSDAFLTVDVEAFSSIFSSKYFAKISIFSILYSSYLLLYF